MRGPLGLALVACVGCGLIGGTAERDTSVMYLWTKRGHEAGDLVHVLCTQASARERAQFMQALGERVGHTRVTVVCSNGE